MDTNGDGAIDATEFQTHQSTQMGNRAITRPAQGQGMGAGGMGRGMGGQGRP